MAQVQQTIYVSGKTLEDAMRGFIWNNYEDAMENCWDGDSLFSVRVTLQSRNAQKVF